MSPLQQIRPLDNPQLCSKTRFALIKAPKEKPQFFNFQMLVGGFNPSEKYESQWEGLSHILENNNCLKPPTRI
jgi:hypothetical protein